MPVQVKGDISERAGVREAHFQQHAVEYMSGYPIFMEELDPAVVSFDSCC